MKIRGEGFRKCEYDLLDLVNEFLLEHIYDLDFYLDRPQYGFESTWFQHAFMRWVLKRHGHVIDTGNNDPELGVKKMDWIVRTMENMKVQIKAWGGFDTRYHLSDLKYHDSLTTRPDIFLWIFRKSIHEDIEKKIRDKGVVCEIRLIDLTKEPIVIMILKKAERFD